VGGCGVLRGYLYSFNGRALIPCDLGGLHVERVAAFRPDVVLWFQIVDLYGQAVDGAIYASSSFPVPTGWVNGPNGDTRILALMEEKLPSSPPTARARHHRPTPSTTNHPDRVAHLNQLMKSFVANHPGDTAFVDLAALACPPAGQRPCQAVVDGIQLRQPDGHHFSPEGAVWAADRMMEMIG
jgi:hypothetical protein